MVRRNEKETLTEIVLKVVTPFQIRQAPRDPQGHNDDDNES